MATRRLTAFSKYPEPLRLSGFFLQEKAAFHIPPRPGMNSEIALGFLRSEPVLLAVRPQVNRNRKRRVSSAILFSAAGRAFPYRAAPIPALPCDAANSSIAL